MGKKGPKTVEVKRSKPHRRRAGWVRGYFRRRTKKAFRNRSHPRNKRRTPEEIKVKGTRKEERKRKRMKEIRRQIRGRSGKQKVRQTVQTTFGKPRGPPKMKGSK